VKPRVENIFTAAMPHEGEECVTIFETATVRIERILSHSHQSPPGFWYDQDQDEWVMVLKGRAVVEFEDGAAVEMTAGDHLTIRRHLKHRVRETSDETLWLAVHANANEKS
jgi:cupin 2 domain-containing protein